MAVESGTQLGPYEILSPLGRGGMGEVWRARDAKLGREVAIKTLPDEFARDADRLSRFEREAKLLASLNHPNIAGIFGLEQSNGMHFLVMELVEGETLAERLTRTALPIDEALDLARQITEALEAAHEKGVIHRDLKPANIVVTPEGRVKVLDFGLAKSLSAGPESTNPSDSPTISLAATRAGVILGTAAYMAPEQAKGRSVDRRADVWSFGCVLYEMLSGLRAFEGEDVSDTLASVLRGEPNLDALPTGTPPRIRWLVKRCLEKDPARRLRDVGDVRLALDGAFELPEAATASVISGKRLWMVIAAAAVLGAVGLFGAADLWTSGATQDSPPLARFTLSGSAGLTISVTFSDVAISPDGKYVVYTVGSPSGLFLRAIDRIEGTRLPGTENALSPFFSPDGEWIGFMSRGTLSKVPVAGGPPVTIASISGMRGASWGSDDIIIVASLGRGLLRVSAAGGEPEPLLLPSQEALIALFPEILPGGRAVLAQTGGLAMSISVIDLRSGEARQVVARGSTPRYSPTGHVLYGVDGSVWAVPFDVDRLQVTGEPVRLVDGVLMKNTGATNYGISQGGSLVYVPGGAGGARWTVAWADQQGIITPMPGMSADTYRDVRISPDGRQIALATQEYIGIYDVTREIMSRLTTSRSSDRSPLWTPDGERVVFTSVRGGSRELYWVQADGSGPEERLLARSPDLVDLLADSWSADGRKLLFTEVRPNISCSPGSFSLEDGSEPALLFKSDFCEGWSAVSPNGRWIAYESTRSGREEIYVERYPELGRRQQISSGGGRRPIWSPAGDELYFITLGGREIRAVTVQSGEALVFGRSRLVFEGPHLAPVTGFRPYDVAPDGRFAVIRETTEEGAPVPDVVLILNWAEELRRRASAR